jgi:DNA-directed RNA polymerase specialized sigma24 family protein
LVRLHYQGLLRLAYVLCGDPAEAEDVVGDVLACAWPRLSRGKVDGEGLPPGL